MNRTLIALVGLALAAAAFFLLFEPSSRSGPKPTPAPAPTPAIVSPDMGAYVPPTAPQVEVTPPMEDAAVVEEDADIVDATPKPEGPLFIQTRPQEVLLRGDDARRVRLSFRLETDNPITHRELINKRRKLVRMMFFLASHRSADAMQGPEGQASFERDLQDRFQNIVRTGSITGLSFPLFEVEPAPAQVDEDETP